eukprot:491889-Amphidinium_carterae.1
MAQSADTRVQAKLCSSCLEHFKNDSVRRLQLNEEEANKHKAQDRLFKTCLVQFAVLGAKVRKMCDVLRS